MVIIDRIYLRCTFKGRENFPDSGGFIIASNHISNLDPPILGLSKKLRFYYVAKENLFKNRFHAENQWIGNVSD